jgi:hypothetical protein
MPVCLLAVVVRRMTSSVLAMAVVHGELRKQNSVRVLYVLERNRERREREGREE